jgi:hypothetical protein
MTGGCWWAGLALPALYSFAALKRSLATDCKGSPDCSRTTGFR